MDAVAAAALDQAGRNCRTAGAILNGVTGSRPLLRYRDPVVRGARSVLEVVAGLGLIDRVAPTPETAGLALVGLAVGALALGAKRVIADNAARGHGEGRPDNLPVISERAQDRAAGLGYSIGFASGFAWRGGTRTGQCHYARAHIEIAPAWRWISRDAYGTAQQAVDHLCSHELGHAAAFGARVFDPAPDPRRNSPKAMLANAVSVCRERDLAVMARGFHDPRGVEEVFAESAALADDAEQGRATRMGEEYLWSHLGATPPALRAREEIDRLVEAAKVEGQRRADFLTLAEEAGRTVRRNREADPDAPQRPPVVEFLMAADERLRVDRAAAVPGFALADLCWGLGLTEHMRDHAREALAIARRDPEVARWAEAETDPAYQRMMAHLGLGQCDHGQEPFGPARTAEPEPEPAPEAKGRSR